MKEPLPDSTVMLSLIAALLLVFGLIFSVRPNTHKLQPSIQWRETPEQSSGSLEISYTTNWSSQPKLPV